SGDGEWSTNCDVSAGPGEDSPGQPYGTAKLSILHLGSGAGVGISGGGGPQGKPGGNGGGAIVLYARVLAVSGGLIDSSGGAGYPRSSTPGRSGGGGSGGSIKLVVGRVTTTINGVTAIGGRGGLGQED